MYRAWPLFEGWPLPQLPPETPVPGNKAPPQATRAAPTKHRDDAGQCLSRECV